MFPLQDNIPWPCRLVLWIMLIDTMGDSFWSNLWKLTRFVKWRTNKYLSVTTVMVPTWRIHKSDIECYTWIFGAQKIFSSWLIYIICLPAFTKLFLHGSKPFFRTLTTKRPMYCTRRTYMNTVDQALTWHSFVFAMSWYLINPLGGESL